MKLPDYITPAEVKRVCKELGLRDWTSLKKTEISAREAKTILKALGLQNLKIAVEDFRQGLQVELEHGRKYMEANVTNNHPLVTGKIVLAHLKETLDYYKRLEVMEIEGDLFKALQKKETAKCAGLYQKLIVAEAELRQAETRALSKSKAKRKTSS